MMPKVSNEIINSIREQTQRNNSDNFGEPYFVQSMKDLKEENPHLANAIVASIDLLRQKFDMNIELQINVMNIAISVYQSIKQQMICEELE